MLIYGRNTVIEALSSSYICTNVFLQEQLQPDSKIAKIISLCKEKGINLTFKSAKELKKIGRTDESQGVLAEIQFKDLSLKEAIDLNKDKSGGYIYISDATYEHNIGAIIRTAECAGLLGVIIPNDIKITSTIAKISTGAIFNIPIIKSSIFNAIKELKNFGYEIVAIERGGVNMFSYNFKAKTVLIIGSEDKGVSNPVINRCDGVISIPQYGKVNSLNMSVASAIGIYKFIEHTSL